MNTLAADMTTNPADHLAFARRVRAAGTRVLAARPNFSGKVWIAELRAELLRDDDDVAAMDATCGGITAEQFGRWLVTAQTYLVDGAGSSVIMLSRYDWGTDMGTPLEIASTTKLAQVHGVNGADAVVHFLLADQACYPKPARRAARR